MRHGLDGGSCLTDNPGVARLPYFFDFFGVPAACRSSSEKAESSPPRDLRTIALAEYITALVFS
jgi:hypothetical protein